MSSNAIVYMGTPEFAVEPLKKLLEKHYNVVAVVTVADKPSGRGLRMQTSPVKDFTLQHNIPLLQPDKLNDAAFINELKLYNADIFVIVAFRKLPEAVWRIPSKGCFNLHASLLPQYRGAAPINHAVINGEHTTGITTFFLDDKIDTGKIIMQREVNIGDDETAGELHDRMMTEGAQLVVDTVESIINDDFKVVEQPSDLISTSLKKAPKIFRDDCKISWRMNAKSVHNFIRGLSPYPGAFGTIHTLEGDKELKVLKSALTGIKTNQTESANKYQNNIPEIKYGIVIIENSRLLVACADELIELLIIQPTGKKVMLVSDFLRGNRSEILSFITD